MSVSYEASIGFGIYFEPGEFSKAWNPANPNSEEVCEIIDDFVYDLNPYSDHDDSGYFFGAIVSSLNDDSAKAIAIDKITPILKEKGQRLIDAYYTCFPELAEKTPPLFKFYFFSRGY